jgi:DNA-binding Xre family transcriptional regulator
MEDSMKPKKLSKKLTLGKRTIANMNDGEMNRIRGGSIPYVTCPILTCGGCTLPSLCPTCYTDCQQETC